LITRIANSISFRLLKAYQKYIEKPLKSSKWAEKRQLNKDLESIVETRKELFPSICKSYGFKYDNTLNAKDIKNKLNKLRLEKTVCNIIGSGKSALKALDEYSNAESYYTCNFGGLLDIPFDLYLIEIGRDDLDNPKISEISELQAKLLEERSVRVKQVVVKNIWEGKMDKKYLDKHYRDFLTLRDIYMPRCGIMEAKGYLDLLFKWMFNDQLFFVLQVHTTVLTLVQLAVWAGYKTIRIYGLEGKGSHFFHYQEIVKDNSLFDRLSSVMPAVSEDFVHVPGYSARNLIIPMAKYLKRKYQIDLILVD
jgi:hypothetical protein